MPQELGDMLTLILTAVALLLLLLVAYAIWNMTIDCRKLDCSCEHPPGFVWLMCRVLWQAMLKRQGEVVHGEWKRALKEASNSGSNEQSKDKHAYEQLKTLQKALRVDWLAVR